MHCANRECGRFADDLTSGVLRLIELEVPPEQRVTRSDSGFPICSVQSRYFWLCERCSAVLTIRYWTGNELILEGRTRELPTGRMVQAIGLPVKRVSPGPQLLGARTA
jgi:hypothetical protein